MKIKNLKRDKVLNDFIKLNLRKIILNVLFFFFWYFLLKSNKV